MEKHLIYHFSFPCEFHGERFSHGPGETSEPVINPFSRRSERAAISSWCGVKSGKSKRTAKKSPRSPLRIPLRYPKHTVGRFSPNSESSSPACLSVCQKAPPSSSEWPDSAHRSPQNHSPSPPLHSVRARLSSVWRSIRTMPAKSFCAMTLMCSGKPVFLLMKQHAVIQHIPLFLFVWRALEGWGTIYQYYWPS